MQGLVRLVDRLSRSYWLTLLAVVVLAILGISVGLLFGLTRPGSVGLYFIVWWTVLFAILPIRIRSQEEAGEVTPGTDPGAPANPALLARTIWTSIASTLVFAFVAIAFPLAGL